MNETVINETIILENFKNNVNLGDTKIVDCYNYPTEEEKVVPELVGKIKLECVSIEKEDTRVIISWKGVKE